MNATMYYGLALLAVSAAMWVAMVSTKYFPKEQYWPTSTLVVWWSVLAMGCLVVAVGFIQKALNLS